VSTLPLLASTSLASPISTTPWTSSQRLQTPTRSTRHALRHPSKTAITSEDGNVGSGKSLLLRGLRADTAVRRPTWVHRSSPLPDTLTWSSSWGFMVLHKGTRLLISPSVQADRKVCSRAYMHIPLFGKTLPHTLPVVLHVRGLQPTSHNSTSHFPLAVARCIRCDSITSCPYLG
jgi:hypothetical protein